MILGAKLTLDVVEVLLILILAGGAAYWHDKSKPVVYDVIGYNGRDSIQVRQNHIPKGNYFCPKYCDVAHAHIAHPVTWKCDMNSYCNHYLYHIPPDNIKPRKPHLYKN